MTPFDPQSGDPLSVPEDEPRYAADLNDSRSCLVLGLGLLAIVLIGIAVLAAPRSGQTTVPGDVSPALSAAQSGAPQLAQHWLVRGRTAAGGLNALQNAGLLRPTSSPAVANVATSGGPSGLTASTPASISGPATWYRWHPGEAAAGPRLRAALGSHWRGSIVSVCAGGCVRVVLSDWCACSGGRVVDLDARSFARLAPLNVGVLRVRVYLAVGLPIAPATDVAP